MSNNFKVTAYQISYATVLKIMRQTDQFWCNRHLILTCATRAFFTFLGFSSSLDCSKMAAKSLKVSCCQMHLGQYLAAGLMTKFLKFNESYFLLDIFLINLAVYYDPGIIRQDKTRWMFSISLVVIFVCKSLGDGIEW